MLFYLKLAGREVSMFSLLMNMHCTNGRKQTFTVQYICSNGQHLQDSGGFMTQITNVRLNLPMPLFHIFLENTNQYTILYVSLLLITFIINADLLIFV